MHAHLSVVDSGSTTPPTITRLAKDCSSGDLPYHSELIRHRYVPFHDRWDSAQQRESCKLYGSHTDHRKALTGKTREILDLVKTCHGKYQRLVPVLQMPHGQNLLGLAVEKRVDGRMEVKQTEEWIEGGL